MCRKQPTPTDILDNPNLTELDKLVFLYIRPRVRNSDGVCNFEQAGKQYSVELKRGQCIVKVASLAELLQRDRQTINKSLERLSKRYSEIYNKGMPYGCLITWLHYDELVGFNSQTHNDTTMTQQGHNNDATANKSVKKVKTEKTENTTLILFEEFRLQYPRKVEKQKAIIAFDKVIGEGIDPQTLINGAKNYALSKVGVEKEYLKHATTWLNGKNWQDEIEVNTTKVYELYLADGKPKETKRLDYCAKYSEPIMLQAQRDYHTKQQQGFIL